MKWYRYTFVDGYVVECAGLSRVELRAEIQKHGFCIRKEEI